MKIHKYLKYARREEQEVLLICRIHDAGRLERRGALQLRRMKITDGSMISSLVIFGKYASKKYKVGDTIRIGPIYWNEEYENFSLKRGGFVDII